MSIIIDFDHICELWLPFYVIYQSGLEIHHGFIWEYVTHERYLLVGNGEVGATLSGISTDRHGAFQYKLLLTSIAMLVVGYDHIFGFWLLFYVIYRLDFEIHQGFIT